MNIEQYTMHAEHLTDKQRESLLGLHIYTAAAAGDGTIGTAAELVAQHYEQLCHELRIGFNLIHKARHNIAWLQRGA